MEVDGLVGAVVESTIDGPAVVQQALEGDGQVLARRVVDGEGVEAGVARCGRGATLALPGVQPNVVVVAARREKGRRCLLGGVPWESSPVG